MKKTLETGKILTILSAFMFVMCLSLVVYAQIIGNGRDIELENPICGNGKVELKEECDNGINKNGNDGICTKDCKLVKKCGNGNIDSGETCESCPEDVGECPSDSSQDDSSVGMSFGKIELNNQNITTKIDRLRRGPTGISKGVSEEDAKMLTADDWNMVLELLDLLKNSDGDFVNNLSNLKNGNTTDSVNSQDLVPEGAIVAFEGKCPTGWVEYTPADGRFIMGSSSNWTDKGGSSNVTLAVGNLPPHNHLIYIQVAGNDGGVSKKQVAGVGHFKLRENEKEYTGYGWTETYGSGEYGEMRSDPINILNPYIKLHYCQKAAASDGVCSEAIFQCANGVDPIETETHPHYFSWKCRGNGGEIASCKACPLGYTETERGCLKFDGSCGTRSKTCKNGKSPTNVRDVDHGVMWDCEGKGERPVTATCRSCDETYGYQTYQENGVEKSRYCGKAGSQQSTTPWDWCRVFMRIGTRGETECVAQW